MRSRHRHRALTPAISLRTLIDGVPYRQLSASTNIRDGHLFGAGRLVLFEGNHSVQLQARCWANVETELHDSVSEFCGTLDSVSVSMRSLIPSTNYAPGSLLSALQLGECDDWADLAGLNGTFTITTPSKTWGYAAATVHGMVDPERISSKKPDRLVYAACTTDQWCKWPYIMSQ
jgi:hypothetical protein